MLFHVRHVDARRHRHLLRVSAVNSDDAIRQVEQELGYALSLACYRMTTRPVLRLVPPLRTPTRAGGM